MKEKKSAQSVPQKNSFLHKAFLEFAAALYLRSKSFKITWKRSQF